MTSPIYKKTAYELVKEAASILGKDGKIFTYREVLDYIREHYRDAPHKNNTIYAHLKALSINNETAVKYHPNLHKRAFLIDLGNGKFKLAEDSDNLDRTQVEMEKDKIDAESIAKEVMEDYLGVMLEKRNLNIFGKYKEFDLVNLEEAIVGDVKYYTFKGYPSAEFSTISEYIWLMEKLEQSSGRKWEKVHCRSR